MPIKGRDLVMSLPGSVFSQKLFKIRRGSEEPGFADFVFNQKPSLDKREQVISGCLVDHIMARSMRLKRIVGFRLVQGVSQQRLLTVIQVD
jgi:hypothetical protein